MAERTRLSVNLNKVALIRNSRGADFPNLIQFARDVVVAGAEGITVHPRPDGRHVRKDDVYALQDLCRNELHVEFNVEGYPSDDFIRMVLAAKPDQVTFVPDPPDALTSDAGWTAPLIERIGLPALIRKCQDAGIRTSLFVDTMDENMDACAQTGANRIELYTGPYAHSFTGDSVLAVGPYVRAATRAAAAGLGVNAGHDLNLRNLRYFVSQVPQVLEVSIGHALVVDCLYLGLVETLRQYRDCLR